MSAPLRRPAVTGDFAAAGWRGPRPRPPAPPRAGGGQLAPPPQRGGRGPGRLLLPATPRGAGARAVSPPPLAPVALMQTLAERGVRVVPVDADEYQTMGCNVLAVEPRRVLMVNGNPRSRAAL